MSACVRSPAEQPDGAAPRRGTLAEFYVMPGGYIEAGPHGFGNRTSRYHAVYLVPADGRSRLARVAPRLQAGARGASGLLERLYGRAIRFDMGTSCGSE